MGRLSSLISTPKVKMGILLLLIVLSALFYYKSLDTLKVVLIAVFSTLLFDLIFIKIKRVELFPSAAIVSGLIVGLLTSPTLPWYEVALTAAIAMAAKNFLRFKNRHIFNPAGLGIFAASVLFGHNVSWWGVSFQTPIFTTFASFFLFAVLLSPGYVSMIRMRRFRIASSFFLVYIILFGIVQLKQHFLNLSSISSATILDPTVLFFSLVMLPEPMTTPHNHKRQLFFGGFVAFIAVIISMLHFLPIPDPLISALLVGNLLFFNFR